MRAGAEGAVGGGTKSLEGPEGPRWGRGLEEAGSGTSCDSEGRGQDARGPKGWDQGRSGAARGGLVGVEPKAPGGLRAEPWGGARGRSRGSRPVPPEREPPAGNGCERVGREGKERGLYCIF